MSYLHTLIADHMRDLSGAEFKVAVYLYRRFATTGAGFRKHPYGCHSHRSQLAPNPNRFAEIEPERCRAGRQREASRHLLPVARGGEGKASPTCQKAPSGGV